MQVGIAAAEAKSHIIVERRGSVGFITLNRPKALNALSLSMVRELLATLSALWGVLAEQSFAGAVEVNAWIAEVAPLV